MKRLLLIGWDAADWKPIHPLLAEGMMPNLQGLIERGVMGNLATLYPSLSPMLWTSIATGKRPFNHGIHGFSEPDPRGGIRPITNISRTTRALWNIATLLDLKSNVIGWWPSHPVEPIAGAMVSNHYHHATAGQDASHPMSRGTVHPERIAANLAALRVHPQDLDPGLMALFLPKLAEMDQEKDRRVWQVAKIVAECTSIGNAAEALMCHEPWTITCVYFDAVDHFCHGFMNFHPPRLDWVDERDFERYREVVRSGYIYHDILLGRLLRHTDADTTVMLVSDHGFHSDHLRPRELPNEPAGPAEQHRHYGIFVAAGPGIKRDERVTGATLLDVCPTALACLDLPLGDDMDGRALTDIFEEPRAVDRLPSWDAVEGYDGAHPKDMYLDPLEARESMRQLVELGYIAPPPEDQEEAVEQTVRELRYNLARSYMDAALHSEAILILEELHERWPAEFRFGILLVNCYLALGRSKRAEKVLSEIVQRKKKDMVLARRQLAKFKEDRKEKIETLRAGDAQALSEKERRQWRKMRARAGWNPMALAYLRGVVAAALGDYENALAFLNRAESAAKDDLRVLLKMGDVYLAMKRFGDARRVFDRATQCDPENAQAWLGVAQVALALPQHGATAEAIEAATRSVALLYHNPKGHFTLGQALHRHGAIPEAVASLKIAVAQNPNFPEAYRRLADIHQKRLFLPAEADAFRQEAREAAARIRLLKRERRVRKPASKDVINLPMPANKEPKFAYDPENTVVVVSGLPRSGTSMMMQMLAAGGIEILTDGARGADEDNPLGYFEFEKVKLLGKNKKWLETARGKAVKIVAHFLPAVKPGLHYKVIFLWRDMHEVLRSQEAMLQRKGKKGNREFHVLAKVFTRHLRGATRVLRARRVMDALYVDYAEAVADPAAVAAKVNAFLGGTLDVDAMIAAVHPEMRRQKSAP